MMKRFWTYLVFALTVATSTMMFNEPAKGSVDPGPACLTTLLDQLNAHWGALALEKDPGRRALMVLEQRILIDSIRSAVKADDRQSRLQCEENVTVHRHHLANMAEMHSMMLNMIEP